MERCASPRERTPSPKRPNHPFVSISSTLFETGNHRLFVLPTSSNMSKRQGRAIMHSIPIKVVVFTGNSAYYKLWRLKDICTPGRSIQSGARLKITEKRNMSLTIFHGHLYKDGITELWIERGVRLRSSPYVLDGLLASAIWIFTTLLIKRTDIPSRPELLARTQQTPE